MPYRTHLRHVHSYLPKYDIMVLPNKFSAPALKVSQDLTLVSGVLQDMKNAGIPLSPEIPPVAFGAGGPM